MQINKFFSILSLEIYDSKNQNYVNYLHFEKGGKINVDVISEESVLMVNGETNKGHFLYRYKHNIHGQINIKKFIKNFKEYFNLKLDGTDNKSFPIIFKNDENESFSKAIYNLFPIY